ncbi:fibrinogen-like protein 1 [Branchiostoma floridae]|uniref:Fibrinogen-like protein 1 n=1 Tax=Branchiostoma floridae TaxID=7739 RepID=A0A9J7K652_BRAFL|nr:fibrinogen-like protein 1 [Branchiostoma floridae]
MDCADLFASGERQDGVYSVGYPPFEVYCRMTTLNCGSTILQRRQDGSVDFGRPWSDYQAGFGDPSGEVWMGLEKAHRLTSTSDYELIIELEDWDGNVAEATYRTFNVGDITSFYALEIGDFAGDAGDSLAPDGRYNANGQQFSTFDVKNDDNEDFNCASTYSEGGWWYPPGCGYAFLNGKYLTDCNPYCDPSQGVVWHTWKGSGYSLKRSTMMMRPVNFDNTPCIPTTTEEPPSTLASVAATSDDPGNALAAGDGIWDKYLAGEYNPDEPESGGNASWTEWQLWKTGEPLPPRYDKSQRPTSGEYIYDSRVRTGLDRSSTKGLDHLLGSRSPGPTLDTATELREEHQKDICRGQGEYIGHGDIPVAAQEWADCL